MIAVEAQWSQPSERVTFIQRRMNVDATSRHCIDVIATFYKRHVAAGKRQKIQ